MIFQVTVTLLTGKLYNFSPPSFFSSASLQYLALKTTQSVIGQLQTDHLLCPERARRDKVKTLGYGLANYNPKPNPCLLLYLYIMMSWWQPGSFVYLGSMANFAPIRRVIVGATETFWPINPKICTI